MKKVLVVIALAFVGQYFVSCTQDSEDEVYEYQIENEQINPDDLQGIDNEEVKDDDI